MSEKLRDLERRVSSLEQGHAVGTERDKSLSGHLDRIDTHISESRSDQRWTFRLVVGIIITAVLTFVLKGGLTLGR